MDDFLQEIYSLIYLEWILLHNNDRAIKICRDINDSNTIAISNDKVFGKVIYYGQGIFEEELSDIDDDKKIFYLHFQLNHLNHAVELFEELLNCAFEATNKPLVRVLLCCSGGLTTSLFASKMNQLAQLENLPYNIDATGYACLFEIASEYDIIMLAPQVAYLQPQTTRRLKDQTVLTIPPRMFATNDFSGALKMVYDWYQAGTNC